MHRHFLDPDTQRQKTAWMQVGQVRFWVRRQVRESAPTAAH